MKSTGGGSGENIAKITTKKGKWYMEHNFVTVSCLFCFDITTVVRK